MITVITVKELEELKEMSRQLVEQTMSKERRKSTKKGTRAVNPAQSIRLPLRLRR